MLIQGVILGLSLSLMAGPLLFAIVQAGIERGFRAGLAVAFGIWVSDILYILLVRYGVGTLSALTALPNFRLWAGLTGGVILVLFGLAGLMTRNTKTGEAHDTPVDRLLDAMETPETPAGQGKRPHWTTLGLPGYWLRGFLLNLINPFTVFFWLGIASAVVIPNNWNGRETLFFFGGMMGVLALTDTAKAYAARQVRRWLTPMHTHRLKQTIGLAMVVFGIVLMIRVL
jgi:threonine/homoserine/homoserine lactone efflux protein